MILRSYINTNIACFITACVAGKFDQSPSITNYFLHNWWHCLVTKGMLPLHSAIHGCTSWGAGRAWLLRGGMRGFIRGACMVLFGGHAWFYSGGGMHGFFSFSNTMRYGQWAGGMHPTGMHSCIRMNKSSSFHDLNANAWLTWVSILTSVGKLFILTRASLLSFPYVSRNGIVLY